MNTLMDRAHKLFESYGFNVSNIEHTEYEHPDHPGHKFVLRSSQEVGPDVRRATVRWEHHTPDFPGGRARQAGIISSAHDGGLEEHLHEHFEIDPDKADEMPTTDSFE
jgi:hypothetical protein